jgi:hypothetical protein
MDQRDFFWFLGQSMDLLRREAQETYFLMSSKMGQLRAGIAVGSKQQVAYFDHGQFNLSNDLSRSDIEVVLTDMAVIDLIDARQSLDKALLNEVIFVKARLDVLEKFDSCLKIYLYGALRAPGMPKLLLEYRRIAAG